MATARATTSTRQAPRKMRRHPTVPPMLADTGMIAPAKPAAFSRRHVHPSDAGALRQNWANHRLASGEGNSVAETPQFRPRPRPAAQMVVGTGEIRLAP